MDIDKLFTLVLGVGFFAAIAVVLRRAWRTATHPDTAYKLGRKARQLGRNTGYAAVGAAHVAGRATGKVENVAGVVGRSFREGRDSTRHGDGEPDDRA